MLINWLQKNVILPISDLINGQCVAAQLKFMRDSWGWSRKQIDDFQNGKLRHLIEYSYNYVPFYHDAMVERGLVPADIQTKEDLVKLPIINKEIIRKEGIDRFTSTAMPRKQMVKRSSSGSTGQPFVYYATRLCYSVNLAANLRGWYNFGWRLGDRYVKISQNPRNNIIKKLQDWVTGCLYVPTADLSDKHLYEVMKGIEKYRPSVIRSYPDPLFIMAKYRLRHQDEFSFCPKIITTTGNVLHSNVRKTIEEAFHCEVYDAYASEGNSNVFECRTHGCYHVSEEYGITEVVDESGNAVEDGEGRLITTDLWNYAHPFIRYDVQDRVEVSSEPCACGNEHLRINRIWGRDNELLTAPSGRRYTVHHFTVYFESTATPELNDSIDQFQFIQHKDGSATIKLVVNERYTDSIGEMVKGYWAKEFGAEVFLEVVDKIQIRDNNKRRFIIVE